jgi:hypothetical protein
MTGSRPGPEHRQRDGQGRPGERWGHVPAARIVSNTVYLNSRRALQSLERKTTTLLRLRYSFSRRGGLGELRYAGGRPVERGVRVFIYQDLSLRLTATAKPGDLLRRLRVGQGLLLVEHL